MSSEEIIKEGFDKLTVQKAIRLVNMNAYKRFQTPPILRVSPKAFGFDQKNTLVEKHYPMGINTYKIACCRTLRK